MSDLSPGTAGVVDVIMETPPHPGSPRGSLRARYEARQSAAPAVYVDIWPGGELVAQVGRSEDIANATNVLRTVGSILDLGGAGAMRVTVEDLADVIATATVSLHERDADGKIGPLIGEDGEPLTDAVGQPIKFDANYGAAIGVPEITTPRGAVFAAFTDGEPPTLDAVAMLTVATTFAARLSAGHQRGDAEAAMGEASAQGR